MYLRWGYYVFAFLNCLRPPPPPPPPLHTTSAAQKKTTAAKLSLARGKEKKKCVCVSGSPPLPSRLLPCYITPTSCNIIRTVFLEFYGTQPVGRSNDSKGNSSLSHSVQRSVAQHRIKVIPRNWFMTGKRRPFHMQKASILSTRSVKILRTGEVQYSTNVPSTYLC